VEAGARVSEGAEVERSVLLPGSRVGEGSHLREVIVGFGAVVPPGSRVERRIVTRPREGAAPGLDDSVVGGVVYTPLDPAGSAA
jgi:ADP-glucose pyrophosphorylase